MMLASFDSEYEECALKPFSCTHTAQHSVRSELRRLTQWVRTRHHWQVMQGRRVLKLNLNARRACTEDLYYHLNARRACTEDLYDHLNARVSDGESPAFEDMGSHTFWLKAFLCKPCKPWGHGQDDKGHLFVNLVNREDMGPDSHAYRAFIMT